MTNENKSRFIVSLDFELLWGVRDKRTIATYGENIKGVRKVIPALLQLFDAYGIQATFATVGFLFARSRDELRQYIPKQLPHYSLPKYSPYEEQYLDKIGDSEEDDVYHYAPSLIRLIQQYPGQEIASHTFSHYYCLENATLESFEADMASALNMAKSYGIDLKSVIFPRNQYSQAHVAVCKQLGFIAYRGNERSAVYQPRKNEEQNPVIRGVRLADAYVNLTGHHTFRIAEEEGMVNIPASRFLRPYSSRLAAFYPLRLQRIKKSLTYAAQQGACYHLWWHPHNFGCNLVENLDFLEEILKHYRHLHHTYGMQSRTMKATAEEILIHHATA